MVNLFIPANNQWVGVAREVTYGTPVAAPTLYVPADTPQYHEIIPPLKDQALRGMMGTTYQQIGGLKHDEFGFKTFGYLDSVFFFLRGALGLPDVLTGSAAPYTHKTSVQNAGGNGQPVSSTVFWNDGAGKAWQMPGAQVAEVKITVKSDGLYALDVKYVGLPSTVITSPTNSPTTALPMPSWNSTLTLGGTGETVYSEMDIDIKRGTEMIPTITGTQIPFAIFAGPVSVTGSLTSVYQGSTDVHLTDYLANTHPALSVKTAPVGDAVNSITTQLSAVAFDDVQVSGTNKWLELKGTWEALMNTTDALDGMQSMMQAILVSSASTVI